MMTDQSTKTGGAGGDGPRQRPEWVIRHLEKQAADASAEPGRAREGYWLLLAGAALCFVVTALTLIYRDWFLSGSDGRAFAYLTLMGFSTIGGLFFIGAYRMPSLADKILNRKPKKPAQSTVSHLRFGTETESGLSVKSQSSARLRRRQARREAMRHMPKDESRQGGANESQP